jgi:hypothetical protein
MSETAPAAVTPGIERIFSRACAWKARTSSGEAYLAGGSVTCIVRTPVGSKPASTATRERKLRSISPAPARTTRATAISATTSAP